MTSASADAPSLAAALARALGREVTGIARIPGGDLNDAYAATLAGDPTRVFVKTSPDAAPGAFAAEAEGLRWLAEPDALPLPEALAVADEVTGPAAERSAPAAPRFLALAADRGGLTPATPALLDRVLARLPALAGPPEPPARVHGDLWGGNVLVDRDGRPWLIDPAAHGAHRELDLAMLRLFGGPGERCFAAYAEVTPLAPGAAERIPLWQLAPLLLHAALFGASYAPRVEAALRQYA